MKVLACHNYYQIRGGEDQSSEDEINNLRRHGHQVVTYFRHNDDVEGVSQLRVAAESLYNPRTYRELSELMQREKPDLVHFTNTFPLISTSAYRAAREQGVPIVQALRNYRLLCPGGYMLRDGKVCEDCAGKAFAWPGVIHKCYRESAAATAVVAAINCSNQLRNVWNDVAAFYSPSNFAREKLLANTTLPRERFHVLPNSVCPDPGFFPEAGEGAVYVGRLSFEKGLDTLRDSWRLLKNPPALKIIGQGPEEPLVRAFAAEFPQVEFLGRLPLAELLQILGKSRCLIMPSVNYETFGRTLIEAFSAGTPVIASRLGAMAEVVTEGKTGLMFAPGNAADLAQKVEQMFAMPLPEMTNWRAACRQDYEARYTPDRNYQVLMQIYTRALRYAQGRRPIGEPVLDGRPAAVAYETVN